MSNIKHHYLDQADASLLLWQQLENFDDLEESTEHLDQIPPPEIDLESLPIKMGDTVQDMVKGIGQYDIKDMPLCVRHAVLAAKIAEDPDSWNLYCYIKMAQASTRNDHNKISGLYHNIENNDLEDYIKQRTGYLDSEDYYYPDEVEEIEELTDLPSDNMDYISLEPFILSEKTEFIGHVANNCQYRKLLPLSKSKTLNLKNDETFGKNASELMKDIGLNSNSIEIPHGDHTSNDDEVRFIERGLVDVRLKHNSQRLIRTSDVMTFLRRNEIKFQEKNDSSGKFLTWSTMSSYRLRYGEYIAARHLREALRDNKAIRFIKFKYRSSSDVSAAIALLNSLGKPFIFSYDKGYNILCSSHEKFYEKFIQFQNKKKAERAVREYDYSEKLRYYLVQSPDHDITNWLEGKNLDGTPFCKRYKKLLKKAEEKKDRTILRNRMRMPINHPRKCRIACYCVSVDANDIAHAGIMTTLYQGKIKMREKASRCMYCRTLYYGVCDNKDHESNKRKYIKSTQDYYGFKPSEADYHKDCYPILRIGDSAKWLSGNMFSVSRADLDGLVVQIVFDCEKIQTDIPSEYFPEQYRERLVPIAQRCEKCPKFHRSAFLLQENADVVDAADIASRIIGEPRLPQFPERDALFRGEYGDYIDQDIDEFAYNPVSPPEEQVGRIPIVDDLMGEDFDTRGEKRKRNVV